MVRAAKPRPTKTSVRSEVGDGGEQADLAVGRLADRDVERGRLGAEDPAVRGAVDGGDVDAVLDLGPGGADLEAGDGAAGLLGLGDDVLGDQPAVGRRRRQPGA